MNPAQKSLRIFLGILMFLLVGCSNKETIDPITPTPEEPIDSGEPVEVILPTFQGSGNTPSNLLHGGIASEYDGYVYTIDSNPMGNVWKTNIETQNRELLMKGGYNYVNVSNGYVFVTGISDYEDPLYQGVYGIFRFTIDGEEFELVKEGYMTNLSLYNNWLYYTDDAEGGIYRIKPDGSENTLLLKDTYDPFVVDQGMIILDAYVFNENQDTHLYSMSLDGGDFKLIVEDTLWGGRFYYGLGYIYYYDKSNIESYYRIRSDGSDKTLVLNFESSDINITNDYLYAFDVGLISENRVMGIYRWALDGSENTLLIQTTDIFNLNVAGNHIYWTSNENEGKISVMSIEGGEVSLLPISE